MFYCYMYYELTRLWPRKKKMLVGGGLSLICLLTIIIVTTSTINIKQTPTPDQGMDYGNYTEIRNCV